MNQQAPQQAQDVETRQWTAAEAKLFTKKHKAYLEAANEVNEFIDFLREQYEIDAKDGWQLGESCFIRQRPEPQVIEQALPTGQAKGSKGQSKRPQATALPEPVLVGVNGADIPSEEL